MAKERDITTDKPIAGEIVSSDMEDSGRVIESLVRGEIDIQIKTAHAFPRDITTFQREAESMACLNADVAEQCLYALPRAGKRIEGPSVRLAEIIASCWGNSRAGARIIDEGERNIVAQGVFIDLERNNAVTFETRRRITNSSGERYNDDMINMTANAACSIAYRNAIFHGIPRAYWWPIYMKARATAAGTMKDIESRRVALFGYFQKMGISEARVLATLEKKGIADVDLDDLLFMRAVATAIDEDKRDPDTLFAAEPKIIMPRAREPEPAKPEQQQQPKPEAPKELKPKQEPKSKAVAVPAQEDAGEPEQQPKQAEVQQPEPEQQETAPDDAGSDNTPTPQTAPDKFDGTVYPPTAPYGATTVVEWEGNEVRTCGVTRITLAKLVKAARKFDTKFKQPGHWMEAARLALKRDAADMPMTVFGFTDEDAKTVLKCLTDALAVA